MSEAGYVFTHLCSAVAFLQDLDATALTISQEEFEAGLQKCQETTEREMTLRRSASIGAEHEAGILASGMPADPLQVLSIAEVSQARRQAGKAHPLPLAPSTSFSSLHSNKTLPPPAGKPRTLPQGLSASSIRQKYRFLSKSADDLSVGEVGALLAEYKELVVVCESLLASQEA